MDLLEKKISEKYIYRGKTISLKVEEVELPNGKIVARDIVEHPGAVAIVPITKDNQIILVEQFRKPVNRVVLEIPAGKFKGGESPKECGMRELEEETGFKAEKLELLGEMVMSPGYSNQIVYMFRAEGLSKGHTNFDEDEFINFKTYSLDEIREMIKDGRIVDAKTIAAIAYLGL